MAVTIFKRDTNLETYVLGAESLSFKKGSKMTDGVRISIIQYLVTLSRGYVVTSANGAITPANIQKDPNRLSITVKKISSQLKKREVPIGISELQQNYPKY